MEALPIFCESSVSVLSNFDSAGILYSWLALFLETSGVWFAKHVRECGSCWNFCSGFFFKTYLIILFDYIPAIAPPLWSPLPQFFIPFLLPLASQRLPHPPVLLLPWSLQSLQLRPVLIVWGGWGRMAG